MKTNEQTLARNAHAHFISCHSTCHHLKCSGLHGSADCVGLGMPRDCGVAPGGVVHGDVHAAWKETGWGCWGV